MKPKTYKIYRQGDLLIEEIDSIPKTAVKQSKKQPIILAYGEATGHHHAIEDRDSADWWKEGDKQFLRVSTIATITHQEHGAITLQPGNHRVSRQREYSPERIRNVAD